ncbi:MAG TPA: DUF5701 family protein [Jiangellaceae bacterium]
MITTAATVRTMHLAEFDRQVDVLLDKGYPKAAGVTSEVFAKHLEPLKDVVAGLGGATSRGAGRIPFVIVASSDLVPADRAVTMVERQGRSGFSVLDADDLARFRPIESVTLPDGQAYVVTDVDTGKATRDVRPNDAIGMIENSDRSPLTVEEGIALVTQFPEAIAPNGGFSLLGSRCGDKRVTAFWISKRAPKLGWCFAGVPHTWLGSASCAGRAGAPGY